MKTLVLSIVSLFETQISYKFQSFSSQFQFVLLSEISISCLILKAVNSYLFKLTLSYLQVFLSVYSIESVFTQPSKEISKISQKYIIN